MRQLLLFCSLVSLAACASLPERTEPTRSWLAGTWLMIEGEPRGTASCASGLPITYAPDGTYRMFEERGVWQLAGDTLTEMATEAVEEVVDPAEVSLGRAFTSRIERLGPDDMRKTFANGTQAMLLRCPGR